MLYGIVSDHALAAAEFPALFLTCSARRPVTRHQSVQRSHDPGRVRIHVHLVYGQRKSEGSLYPQPTNFRGIPR
jgi:hypothetical protein